MESAPSSAVEVEGSRNGGRRKNRGAGAGSESAAAKKKKAPQRGMGVAQLERLRLQADHQPLNMSHNNNPPPLNVTVPSIVFSPAAVSRPAVFQAAMINHGGVVPLHHHQFPHHGLYGFGGSNGNFSNLYNVGNVNENSKELSSTQNFTTFNPSTLSDHHHLHCNICHKKKRVNDNGNLGYNQWVNIIGENQDYFTGFTTKPFLHAGYADKGVVGMQQNGGSSSSPTGKVKEYEFFPAERNNSVSQSCSQDDHMVMMRSMMTSESSSPVAAAAAMATSVSGEASFDASSPTTTSTIDLSLRLSY